MFTRSYYYSQPSLFDDSFIMSPFFTPTATTTTTSRRHRYHPQADPLFYSVPLVLTTRELNNGVDEEMQCDHTPQQQQAAVHPPTPNTNTNTTTTTTGKDNMKPHEESKEECDWDTTACGPNSCHSGDTTTPQHHQQALSLPAQHPLAPFFSPLTTTTLATRVNVEDAKDKFIVSADLPGFHKEDVKISLNENDGLLTISAKQKQEILDENKEKKYIRKERHYSHIERSIRLPKGITSNNIIANLEHGVLKVEVPKIPLVPKKEIAIQ